MKKILIATLLFFATVQTRAQDLVKKIPANAFAVATVKGNNIFKLMLIKDFNQSYVGKKILEKTAKSLEKPFSSIEDFGVDLEKNMYYFNQLTDSISYNCFLLPLKDANKFERLINQKQNKISVNGDVKTMVFPDSSGILKWDKKMLYITSGSIKSNFFSDSAKAAQYGIKEVRYQNEYGVDMVTDSVAVVADEAADAVMSAEDIDSMAVDIPPPIVRKEKHQTTVKKSTQKKITPTKGKKKKHDSKANEAVVETVITPAYPANNTDTAYATTTYVDAYAKYELARAAEESKKKALALTWLAEQAEQVFTSNYPSIETNKSYKTSLDDKAVAQFWVSNLQNAYNYMMPRYFPYGKYSTKGLTGKLGATMGYKGLNAKLFMDGKSVRISTGIEMDKNWADAYKRITSRKLNKKFLKYVNSDKAIGFIGYSIDTKSYLQEFPKFMRSTYGMLLADKKEEIDLATDLFSLLLDEEAVSKVIKGDAFLIVNDVKVKDVTYTGYDYDDNYDRKEVIKTKKETVPDFLFMFSSDDTRLITKLIKYGIDKNYVTVDNSIYKIKAAKSPIDIYFMIKDGIVFFGNSLSELQSISNNTFKGNISRADKNLARKSNFSFLFNAKNLANKLTGSDLGDAKTIKKYNETLGLMSNIYLKTNPIKGNVVSFELGSTIPDGQENALKYLFALIENAAK
ncbi:hypothetical protein ABIB40_003303 [Pedobacter sp. UYP30]|uniref:hypothetical protein n=1 Tax=Pedobacter sp. UYP30 TaxID=1756400 RepID=UPI0033989216